MKTLPLSTIMADLYHNRTYNPYRRFIDWRNQTWIDEAVGAAIILSLGYHAGYLGPAPFWIFENDYVCGVIIAAVVARLWVKWSWRIHTEARQSTLPFRPNLWLIAAMAFVLIQCTFTGVLECAATFIALGAALDWVLQTAPAGVKWGQRTFEGDVA